MKKAVLHKQALVALFCAVLAFSGGLKAQTALAASCQAIAASLAASEGGVVLSASSQGDKCRIRLLIKSGNGPPKQKTFVVSK